MSAEAIRLWLLELNIPFVKAHKETRQQVVQKLKALKVQASTKKQKTKSIIKLNKLIIQIYTLVGNDRLTQRDEPSIIQLQYSR